MPISYCFAVSRKGKLPCTRAHNLNSALGLNSPFRKKKRGAVGGWNVPPLDNSIFRMLQISTTHSHSLADLTVD